MSKEQLMRTVQEQAEMLKALQAQLAKKPAAPSISFKVSPKGGVSVYGLGRFPVTLYGSQWERLMAKKNEIMTFIKDNQSNLASK